jgi:hypothetical protein
MSLEIERFPVPTTTRAARASLRPRPCGRRFAGRTCGALPRGRAHADRLRQRLDWGHDGGVVTAALEVEGNEPLRQVAARLESMLNDVAGNPPGPGVAERALYAERTASAEDSVVPAVRPEDVVVLSDPLSAALAQAVRERGAHRSGTFGSRRRAVPPPRRHGASCADSRPRSTPTW